MSIEANILSLKTELDPLKVKLVAVSKTKPNEDILQAYQAGQRIFGENTVQELVKKQEELPKDIEWHLVGHLQSNKVKYIAPFISLIHAVDSLKLLAEVNKQAQKNNRIINCLLQIHIADEDTKFGLDFDEAIELLLSSKYQQMQHIRIVGLMGIATNTENQKKITEEFYELRTLFKGLKASFFQNSDDFSELSMGMSSDYKLAIEQGSTMVRLGSNIFGERNYPNKTGI
jgi:pyridoxal phosphate enzyme (YggS family)